MTKLTSPAPHGLEGLRFGAATKPYSIFRRHKGKDWKWRYGDEERSRRVVAPIGGTVVAAHNDGGFHEGWGNHVDIQVNRSVMLRLAHHETGTVLPRVGRTIAQNDPVGVMGDTGKTTGIHLHEGLMIDGVWVDPDDYRGPNGKHLPGTPIPAGSTGYKHTKVVLADLNLRTKPKTGKVLTVIPAGTFVKTGKTAAGWTPVKHGKTTGWVAAEFAVLRTKTVSKNGLLLRDRPATLAKGAKIRARLPKGKKVTVLGVHGKTSKAVYWKVRVGGRTGWVHSGNLK